MKKQCNSGKRSLTRVVSNFVDLYSVETTPVTEETPVEEQSPVEEPIAEEEKEMALKDEGKGKKSIFSSFCGCFGGKSQVVVLEKPVAQEQAKEKIEESGQPTEDNPAEEKPEEKGDEKE
jgi:hypothetical protein